MIINRYYKNNINDIDKNIKFIFKKNKDHYITNMVCIPSRAAPAETCNF